MSLRALVAPAALGVLLIAAPVAAHGSAARANTVPTIGNYFAWSKPLQGPTVTRSNDATFLGGAGHSHGYYTVDVDISSPRNGGMYSSIGLTSKTPLHVGSYAFDDTGASDPPTAFHLIVNSFGPGSPFGVMRITQFNADYRTGAVQFAATFVSRDRGTTTPTYGAIGYDTSVPLEVPGETAQDRFGDFNGDGLTDVAVWRPSTGQWFIRGHASVTYGRRGDVPVPGDYDGSGRTDIAVWRPSTGQWWIRGHASVTYGRRGDVPVSGDYDGNGRTDIAVWRPSTGQWFIRGHASVTYGRRGDQPAQSDYDGAGRTQIAVFDPAAHRFAIRGQRPVVLGRPGDRAVSGFYPLDGAQVPTDGRSEPAVWRPGTGEWMTREIESHFGRRGDVPVPGCWNTYDDNREGPAVFRASDGTWHLDTYRGQVVVRYGRAGDVPV